MRDPGQFLDRLGVPFTEEKRLIAEAARNFARTELAPGAAARDRDRQFPESKIAQMAELGLLVIARDLLDQL